MVRAVEVLRRVAERTARLPLATWYWGDAIAIDGLLEAGDLLDGACRDDLIRLVDHWYRFTPAGFDDALAPGRSIHRLVAAGDLDPGAARRAGNAIARLPLLEDFFPALEPHRPQFRFGLCIDAVYHLPLTVALLGPEDDSANLRKAYELAVGAMERLECETGWAQWYDVLRGANNGIAWTRGLGWGLLGLLDLLGLDGRPPGTLRKAAEDLARSLLDLLAATQRPSGHWAAVLGRPDCPEETSTAAFYVAASLHPEARRLGWEEAEATGRAVEALLASVDEGGICQGVSADILPSWDLDGYEHFTVEPSPWGQGAALRALAALVGTGHGGPTDPC